jgi:hypothetical protein
MRALLINPPVLTVDAYQVYSYADVIPYGLYQIATHLQQEGHQVRVIDMVEYLEGGYQSVISPERRFAVKPGGDADTRDCSLDVYRYGHDPQWLGERLAEGPAPDEVLVTCCLAFNWEPAHQVIRQCREAFPRASIRLGGFYPTLFPEHAKKSGADEVFEGRWEAADRALVNLDLCENLPRNWLFRLVAGCRYRCSFCINSATEPQVICEPDAAAAEIRRLNSTYGIREFSNWDPNVLLMPEVLSAFLEEVSRGGPPVELRFDMGIPPHLLTRDLATRMRAAGTVAMTVPFESADPEMLRRFGKPYRLDDSRRALEICAECGFDISRFHCTFILGVRGEDLETSGRRRARRTGSGCTTRCSGWLAAWISKPPAGRPGSCRRRAGKVSNVKPLNPGERPAPPSLGLCSSIPPAGCTPGAMVVRNWTPAAPAMTAASRIRRVATRSSAASTWTAWPRCFPICAALRAWSSPSATPGTRSACGATWPICRKPMPTPSSPPWPGTARSGTATVTPTASATMLPTAGRTTPPSCSNGWICWTSASGRTPRRS